VQACSRWLFSGGGTPDIHTADFPAKSESVLPRSPSPPGRLERHGFEYRRNGTLSLYAALDVKTGKVQGKIAERHTSVEFVSFLEQVIAGCLKREVIARAVFTSVKDLSRKLMRYVRVYSKPAPLQMEIL
jgi:hypothetical protein